MNWKEVAKLTTPGLTYSQVLTGSNPESPIQNSRLWTNLMQIQRMQTNLPTIPTNQSVANIGLINLLAETVLGFSPS